MPGEPTPIIRRRAGAARGVAGKASGIAAHQPVSPGLRTARAKPVLIADGIRPSSQEEDDLTADTVTLWRPVGPEELELIRQAGMKASRLPDQPIFYPVTMQDYAVKIARDWNVPRSGVGYVTRFAVRRDVLDRYPVQEAGGRAHSEYWVPAGELDAFNAAIVGDIEIVQQFGDDAGEA